jgi:eukaryotic-like serine/threonine-protein kinase
VLLATGVLWVIYLALEPYVRRFWPDGILGWTRLMSGYVKDPRVGRDVLLGCVVAIAMTVLEVLYNLLPPLIGRPSAVPVFQAAVGALTGSGALVSLIFDQTVGGVFVGMFAVLAYVLLRLALRRTSLAIAAAVVLLALVQAQSVLTSGAPLWMSVLFQIGVIGIITTVVVRYGLLVTAIASAVGNVLGAVPLRLSLSHWTATTSDLTMAAVIALTVFGFYASRAGQPLFGTFGDDVKP